MSTENVIEVVTVVFLLGVAVWTLIKERRYTSLTLTDAADAAVRQVRSVAHRRAAASSSPIPTHLVQEHTPVEGVSLPGPAITVTIGPDPADPKRDRRGDGTYSLHRKRGTLKISER